MKCPHCSQHFNGHGACPHCGRVPEIIRHNQDGATLIRVAIAILIGVAVVAAVVVGGNV